ncbi:unnamed protein product [Schistosoma mattheei]|uniref:Uncharacterized protein n=1 Tax=Schistosoma mattheei TaxID=31246 RepID=A0A183PTA9_9TREM|nr:unnamed protein product [Schistosoma mattheei]
MAFPNDSHISDEIPCKSEENMLSERNYDRKPDVVLMDANFSNDSLLCNDILNEFHENISEESNPDVISYITYPHNAFDPCEKPVLCEPRVLSDLDFDESVPTSFVNSNTNEHILDTTKFLSNAMSDRLRMNLRRRHTTDYKHFYTYLSCGGCGV